MSLLQNRVTFYLKWKWLHMQYKKQLPPAFKLEQAYVAKNRAVLKKVHTWIDDASLDQSFFRYGVTPEARPLLDLPVGDAPTYTDMLCSFHDMLGEPVRYLELGVSVGKNFLQVASNFQQASITGFEIEECNPVLEHFFTPISKEALEKGDSAFTEKVYTRKRYQLGANQITYLSADIMDEASWKALAGQQFNLIFSDAFHSPDALLWEISMLLKYNLIKKDRFVIMWDDLGGHMTEGFLKIKKILVQQGYINSGNAYIIKTNGWLGQNWPQHEVGIITNLFQ
jgi:hypothetical protein